jgi:tRNA (cytidine56-2'-O)-methyltransferase
LSIGNQENNSNLEIEVTVLRIGHRLVRDARMSTHLGLVARAFGASSLIISGSDDETVESIRKVSESWGGKFQVSFSSSWRSAVKNWEGKIAHLTMYGEHIDTVLPRIRSDLESESKTKLLVVVGAEKVPGEIYKLADYNLAVGAQPHSEIAALAVFLDRLFMGGELYHRFDKARLRIIPKAKGKQVVDLIEN